VAIETSRSFLLVGWFAFGLAQQLFALRRSGQRLPSAGLALTLGGTAGRLLALHVAVQPVVEGAALVWRSLELLSLPLVALGGGLFYLWLAGWPFVSRAIRAWLVMAATAVCLVVLSLAWPGLQFGAINFSYAFIAATTLLVVIVVRRVWADLEYGERRFIACGILAVVVGGVADILAAAVFGLNWTVGLMPVGMLVETLCQAMILARRNAHAHARVHELASELEVRNVVLASTNQELAVANAKSLVELEERRRVQGELDVATQQLTQAENMATLGMLMAGIAHDLRNPLNYVQGAAEQLRSAIPELRSDDDVRREKTVARVEKVVGWVEQGTATMDAISLAMRNQARGGSAEIADVNVREVVNEALVLCRSRTKLCEVEVDVQDATIRADATGLGQLVMNLVSNAADALVEARERNSEQAMTIRVSAAVEAGAFHLAVEDSGPGSPEHVRARILEPFFTTKPRGQGTGLGLAIVQRVVKQHTGTLEIGTSALLAGARFSATWSRS